MTDVKIQNPFADLGETAVKTALDSMRTEVKAIFDAAKTDGVTDYSKISSDDSAKVAEFNEKLAQAQIRMEEIDAAKDAGEKLANLTEWLDRPDEQQRPPAGGEKRERMVDGGKAFIESDAFKKWRDEKIKDREATVPLAGFLPGVGVALKSAGVMMPRYPFAGGMKATLGTDSTLTDVDVQYPPEVTRMPGLFTNILAQPPNIADLMIQVATGQNAIKYMEQTTRTSGAVETAEGAAYGESSYEWTDRTDPIRKIGHIFPVTEELLDDEPFLRGIINSEMRLGVLEREDLQLLKGNGTGQNIDGIINRSGVQNVNRSLTGVTGQNYAEAILDGIVLVRKQHRVPSAILTSLTTWAFMRKAKGSDNDYLMQTIQDEGIPRLWGLPVVPNENVDDYDTATNVGSLVGAFASDAYVVRREGVELSVSDSHDDYFARDTLVIKARERVGLAVTRAAAFCTVTSTA